jgi:prophage antirepressor-like protein
MDILKAFKLLDKTIEINIQGTPENPLFHAKQIGNLLEISNIKDNIRNFTDDEKVEIITYTLGGPQKTNFLTEIGLYKLLGRSRKPIAHTFQKWMINTIKEIRINGIYELKDKLDKLDELKDELKQENEVNKLLIMHNSDLKNHTNLIKAYDQKNVIYICRLKYIDDKKIIKIGSTQNIKERVCHMNNQFDNIEIILLDIIEINNYRKFEKYLHNNDFIKKYYYPLLKKDKSESKETYLVNDEELKEFLKIMNQNKNLYKDIDPMIIEEIKLKQLEKEVEKMKVELELKELLITQKNLDFETLKYKVENNILLQDEKTSKESELYENNSDEDLEENYLSDEELDLTKTNFQMKVRSNGIRSPKVYQYKPDNLSDPIKIFDSPADVERSKELETHHISPGPLRKASKNNTIYKGYRWLFLNRTEDPPTSIPETVDTKHKSPDIKYIAMIDVKKTKILDVFATQKDAVEARNMKSRSFTRAIQQQSLSSGHYWNFFENCSEEMKNEYLANHKLPEKFPHNNGKKVEQIDPKTKNVLKVYNCNRDVIKNFQISSIKLQECLETGQIHNGYIWKRV